MVEFPDPRYRQYGKFFHYWLVLFRMAIGQWCRGNNVSDLERNIEYRLGISHAIAMPKARVGVYLVVKALVQPGQKVVLSPYTISDIVNMVLCAGAVPVFADLEEGTCNVGAADIEKCIEDDTGAVLITHLHGLSADLVEILALCKKHNIPLIEDTAQAFGTRHGDRHIGVFGRAGIFSFGQYKNVNSFFGGMVVTSDDALAEKLRADISRFPFQEKTYFLRKMLSSLVTDIATFPILFKTITFWIFRKAYLSKIGFINRMVSVDLAPTSKTVIPDSYLRRLSSTQAKLITNQLDSVDDNCRSRIENAEMYHSALSNIPGISLPPYRNDFSHTYSYYPLLVENRDDVLAFMMRNYCDVAAQHLKNCASLECFWEYARDCPIAQKTAERVILLPTYPRYGKRSIKRNIETLRRYFLEKP
jgi:perosamine synthetase